LPFPVAEAFFADGDGCVGRPRHAPDARDRRVDVSFAHALYDGDTVFAAATGKSRSILSAWLCALTRS
jgi:hypothetical protein